MTERTNETRCAWTGRGRPAAALLVGAAGLLSLSGCIERRLQITSDPPGATVWLNDVQIGTTPTEAEFRYFSIYDVRLHKDGYEPIATRKKAEAPFYEYPGPDLIAEAWPGTTQTIVTWNFKLEPALEKQGDPATARDELIARAHQVQAMVPPPGEVAKTEKAAEPAKPTEKPAAKPDEKATEKPSDQPPVQPGG